MYNFSDDFKIMQNLREGIESRIVRNPDGTSSYSSVIDLNLDGDNPENTIIFTGNINDELKSHFYSYGNVKIKEGKTKRLDHFMPRSSRYICYFINDKIAKINVNKRDLFVHGFHAVKNVKRFVEPEKYVNEPVLTMEDYNSLVKKSVDNYVRDIEKTDFDFLENIDFVTTISSSTRCANDMAELVRQEISARHNKRIDELNTYIPAGRKAPYKQYGLELNLFNKISANELAKYVNYSDKKLIKEFILPIRYNAINSSDHAKEMFFNDIREAIADAVEKVRVGMGDYQYSISRVFKHPYVLSWVKSFTRAKENEIVNVAKKYISKTKWGIDVLFVDDNMNSGKTLEGLRDEIEKQLLKDEMIMSLINQKNISSVNIKSFIRIHELYMVGWEKDI